MTIYRMELFFACPDSDPNSPTAHAIMTDVREVATDQALHEIAAKHGAQFSGRSFERMPPQKAVRS